MNLKVQIELSMSGLSMLLSLTLNENVIVGFAIQLWRPRVSFRSWFSSFTRRSYTLTCVILV